MNCLLPAVVYCKLVSCGWSVSRSVRFLCVLDCYDYPWGLEFLSYCTAGAAAEFAVFLAAASHFFPFLLYSNLYMLIELVTWWLRANKRWLSVVYVLLFALGFDSFLENISWSCPCSLCPILSASPRIRPRAGS